MFRPLICALGFLTRIPVPQLVLSERDVARSAGFFAWVGLLLGALLYMASLGLRPLGEPLSSVCLITCWVLLTGGFHLDGLADTVDGLSGGRGDAARALEIMRDSRIGAHGATALVLALGLKTCALWRARELESALVWLTPVVARFGCTLLLSSFPYARATGLGSAFAGRVGLPALALGLGALALPLSWLDLAGQGYAYGASAALGLMLLLGLAFWAKARLGGLTGDVHGAAIELGEIGMLLGLSAFPLR